MARHKNGKKRVRDTYLQYLVADEEPAVFMSRTLRIEAADKHRHSVSVLMSCQGDTQSPSVLLENNHQHFMSEMLILLLYLVCKIKKKIKTFSCNVH